MSNQPVLSATLPAGTYVVGDPCYSVADDQWDGWLEASDFRNRGRGHVLRAPINGHMCVGVRTEHGDGEYTDNQGNSHGVDSGMIGLVHIEAAGKNDLDERHVVVTFDESVECFYGDGIIHLGPIEIQTGDVWECEICGDSCYVGADRCSDCESWECEDCGCEVEYGDSVCSDCDDERRSEDEDDA